MADVKQSASYERGARILKAIGIRPRDRPQSFPGLPPEQADDVQRKLTEFCVGDTWAARARNIDLKTRRLLTIAALVCRAKSAR